MIKAIFFDVDGTLVSHTDGQTRTPDSAVRALRQLKERGILLFLSTGRQLKRLSSVPLDLSLFDGFVTLNGQVCVDRDHRFLCGNAFSAEDTQVLVDLFRAKVRPMYFVEQDRFYMNMPGNPLYKKSRSAPPEIGDYGGGILYQAMTNVLAEGEDDFAAQLPPTIKTTRWGEHSIDIIPADGGKSVGIRKMLPFYGLLPEEIMAFGDAENDIDMLEFAAIGVAMGNGTPGVKAAANYVTASVDEDGVARALVHFGLIESEE